MQTLVYYIKIFTIIQYDKKNTISLQSIDWLEQATNCVHFFNKLPENARTVVFSYN